MNIVFTKGISAHHQAYKVTSTVIIGRGSKVDLNPARSAKVGRDPTVPDITVPATIGCPSGTTKSASGRSLCTPEASTGSGSNEQSQWCTNEGEGIEDKLMVNRPRGWTISTT